MNPTVLRRPVVLPTGGPTGAVEVFNGDARVGTRECRVRCLTTPGCDYLWVSGAGAFAISHAGDCIEAEPEAEAGDAMIEEALLGPAFALSLARRGVFLFHASAVVLGPGVIGFLGESGAGKSTLARLLAAEGLARAADDLLAVEGTVALPHFPQLKLGEAEMAAILALEPSYPLLGLYELAPGEVGIEELPAVSAVALLLRHTIAGRLFASDLLAAQLDFAAGLAGRVPVRRLRLPRRMDVGGEVLRCLQRTRT